MIYIASDHAGFELKNTLCQYLKEQDLEVEDVGPFKYDKDDDYPDWGSEVVSSLGKIGDTFDLVMLRGMGSYHCRQYEIIHSDDCEFDFIKAEEIVEVVRR